MKILRKMKKGFTIVELVIVIAVIAVLTAILVPTFINLNKKANKASDNSLVTNLNTALKMAEGDNEIFEGHKLSDENITMHDAVLDLKAYGYYLEQLATKSDEDLLYSLKENKFYLSSDSEINSKYSALEKVQYLWAIQNSVTGSEKYSVYAGAKWSQANVSNLHVGLDVGYREDIRSIDYSSTASGNVIIRTNSFETTLDVSAPNGTVKHYGLAGLVDIASIANNSYHEHGEVSLAKIANGRIVVTEDAEIGGIHAVATNDEFNDITVAVVGDADVPTITRDKVSIDDQDQEGVYSQFVLEVQTLDSETAPAQDSEYVWISVSVDGSGNSTVSTEVATSSTELTPETIIPESEQSSAASSIADDAATTLKIYDVVNETQLGQALAATDDNVVINVNEDFVIANIAFFTRSTTIYGFGHEIKGQSNRVFRASAPNIDIKIYDLKITSICTASSDVRGISFDNASAGSSLLLDRCSISASFYVINAVAGADNLNITIKNGTVAAGWAALNLYSNNSTITIDNSTLRGLNDKGESTWNSFNTITLDGNCLNKGKSNVGTAGSNNTINISKSTIFASSKSGNKQFWIGMQYGAVGNSVVVDSETKIIDAFDEDMRGVFNIGYYCNYKTSGWDYYANDSTIKIGNETISLVTEFDGDGNLVNVYYHVE